jgi:uncharacterized ion transporter superfamily protein YfcC
MNIHFRDCISCSPFICMIGLMLGINVVIQKCMVVNTVTLDSTNAVRDVSAEALKTEL